jgi:hypothetical protein
MSIKKPLGLSLLVGLMAMAFVALPAMASAAPQLTNPDGTTVAVGTTLTATSTNATTVLTKIGTLRCEEVIVHGVVTENSGTSVKIKMDEPNVDSAAGCFLNEETPVAIKPTLNSISLTASSKTAVFGFTGGGLTESSMSTVTYTSPATSIHVEGPVTGTASGNFSGDFTIEAPKGMVTVD